MAEQHGAAEAAAAARIRTAQAERREREELFSFHPAILSEAGELPRRTNGSDYRSDREQPVSAGDSNRR